MRLFNTASRQVEEFTPLDSEKGADNTIIAQNDEKVNNDYAKTEVVSENGCAGAGVNGENGCVKQEIVKIYTCGPTVYGYQHIGNYAAYVYWDLLVRTLIQNGYVVRRVINLTDVGHLASDADDGEDKLEKGARRDGKTVWEIAEKYIADFLANFEALNLVKPEKFARATDYIRENIELVEKLSEKGYVYETSDGIYFDTSKFAEYPDFARLNLEQMQAGARVAFNPEKRNLADFAVWKFVREGEDHAMQWEYMGRAGYPGWHIECSSIIHKELGEPIDIHTGGVDHIPVHHTNEIAQSEAAFDKTLAKYWVHCNFITVDGEKMSKSLGNVYTLADLMERGFSPLDFKLWVLQGHYQTLRNFTFDDLAGARARRLKWRNRIAMEYQKKNAAGGVIAKIKAALDNNLNSAEALAAIDMAEKISLDEWRKIDEMLGLNLVGSSPDLSDSLSEKMAARAQARAEKDYGRADEIRAELAEMGVGVLDLADGAVWQYLN